MNATKKLFLFLALAIFAGPIRADDRISPAPAMVGEWTGVAEIVVNWTKQRTLTVDLMIRADGTVTGRIGDATLTNGRFASNRGWLGRVLNLATDYIIVGELTGEILAAEQIRRERVNVPLNWSEGHFQGGLHTSGSKFGDREKMILSATRLHLQPKEPKP